MSQSLNFNQVNQAEIMARILFLHRLKGVFLSVWVRLAVFVGLVGVVSLMVSIRNVFANAVLTGGLFSGSRYIVSSVLETEYLVQFLLAGLFFFSLLLARDIFNNIKLRRHFTTV
ncbi:hypothetical protein IT398_01065 [Candidatus Nomurabacteria bacterium]|nr:hypothetical protein [Candidatus Nomurabacteria bacterium]